jgi:hypothetical protein
MESGFDAPKALLLLVNKHCKEIDKDLYTITPVQTCYSNLKLKFKKIRKRSQELTDVNSPWCKARKNWYSQLLIQFGSLPNDELEKLCNPETKIMPAWFDIDKLNKLYQSQVGWWDERLKKCQIGGLGNATHAVQFPCDKNGRLSLDDETYDETEATYLSVKYEKEVRLCLGCAIMEDVNGKEKGKTAVPFDYPGNIFYRSRTMKSGRKPKLNK